MLNYSTRHLRCLFCYSAIAPALLTQFAWGANLAIAATPPRIGLLQGLPEPVYNPTIGPPCTYYLHFKNSNSTQWQPVLDRQQENAPVMNIDGKNITLKLVRRKYARAIVASEDELKQEIFAYRKLRVIVNYKVIDSNYEGVNYEAAIVARRNQLTSRVKARGFYGCPRTP